MCLPLKSTLLHKSEKILVFLLLSRYLPGIMAKIQELLKDKKQHIDVDKILNENPWITGRNRKCILSPDSDGLLCGLFLSHYLNWQIVGFYDGKVAVIKDGISVFDDDVSFIDIEIYREGVKSMGHHMLSMNNRALPENWDVKFKQCIQPNLIRGYDRKQFRLKYPLATIHLIIALLENHIDIEVKESAIFPLLFTDGTYNVMTSYPENVLNWWDYLNVSNSKLLSHIFQNEQYSLFKLMLEMDNFFRKRDNISAPKERGDRLKISNRDSSPYNIDHDGITYQINEDAKRRCEEFLMLLSNLTGWDYKSTEWHFDNLNLFQFTKSDFVSKKWTLTNGNWSKFLELNPLSWAMTSGINIEFTEEYPDKLK